MTKATIMRNKLTVIALAAGLFFMTSCSTKTTGGSVANDQRGFAQYTNLFSALRSVGGITIRGSESNPDIALRGGGSGGVANVQPLFVVNGQIIGTDFSQVNAFVLPANIKGIKILNSMSAVNRYGQEGRGGVIVITLIN